MPECGFDRFARQLSASALAEGRDRSGFRRKVSRWAFIGALALPLLAFARSIGRRHAGAQAADGARSSEQNDTELKRLRPADAPALFAMLHKMRVSYGAPAVDAIYLDDNLAAVARQAPVPPRRWSTVSGWWGGNAPKRGGAENQLIIGRQLLRAVSNLELYAVIAHELGHFASGDGRLAARFHSLHGSWSQVGDCAQGSGGDDVAARPAWLTSAIAGWYLRRLLVLALPLCRRAELEADQFARRIVGSAALSQALVRIAIACARVDDLDLAGDSDDEILARLLAERTRMDDTHPCLRERLSALAVRADIPAELSKSAESLIIADS